MTVSLVECRSDYDYLGYPLAFIYQGKRIHVEQVRSETHHPRGYTFLVQNSHFGLFLLDYDSCTDLWSVQPY